MHPTDHERPWPWPRAHRALGLGVEDDALEHMVVDRRLEQWQRPEWFELVLSEHSSVPVSALSSSLVTASSLLPAKPKHSSQCVRTTCRPENSLWFTTTTNTKCWGPCPQGPRYWTPCVCFWTQLKFTFRRTMNNSKRAKKICDICLTGRQGRHSALTDAQKIV